MIVTLQKLQSEQARWAAKNFGDAPSTQPLLGLIEEVGELAHAVLKREQGIRTNENHDDKLQDAIGDIVIYAADYATRENISLAAAFDALRGFNDMGAFKKDATIAELVFSISVSVGRLCKYHSSRINLSKDYTNELRQGYLGGLLVQLDKLCRLECLDINAVIKNTWEQVQKRDWKKNPQTGVSESKAA